MRRMGVLGSRHWDTPAGFGGCGQGKLRKKDVGRESGLDSWSLDWVLRRDVLWVDFSGSRSFSVGGVGSGHAVGMRLSNIVLRLFGWVAEGGRRALGFRVGVSTSKSGLLSSSRYRFIMNCVGEKGLSLSATREFSLWKPRVF